MACVVCTRRPVGHLQDEGDCCGGSAAARKEYADSLVFKASGTASVVDDEARVASRLCRSFGGGGASHSIATLTVGPVVRFGVATSRLACWAPERSSLLILAGALGSLSCRKQRSALHSTSESRIGTRRLSTAGFPLDQRFATASDAVSSKSRRASRAPAPQQCAAGTAI
jgi:hypothetical protein